MLRVVRAVLDDLLEEIRVEEDGLTLLGGLGVRIELEVDSFPCGFGCKLLPGRRCLNPWLLCDLGALRLLLRELY